MKRTSVIYMSVVLLLCVLGTAFSRSFKDTSKSEQDLKLDLIEKHSRIIKRTTHDNEDNSHDINMNVSDLHDNSSHGDGSDDHGGGQSHSHGIHVASWNFEFVKSPFIIAVFVLTAGIAKLGFHRANFLSSKVPESCLLIILGTVVGAILEYALPDNEFELGMDSKLFFLYLLPPIILDAAYSLHDRTFYENVGTVLIYAVIGTILNCFLIGPSLYALQNAGALGAGMAHFNLTQILVFSAIIVAVDPVAVLAIFQEVGVNNTLYFLVFGESLLNDAVTVVLYNTMRTLNTVDHITIEQIVLGIVQFFVVSLGGLSMGIIFGLITAIITKFTEHCRVVEPLAVFILAYIAYLGAEMVHFSGIISIIGCGLTQAQYAFHNISRKSYTTVKYFSKMQSAACDCIIFMFLGVSLFKKDILDPDNWHAGFIAWVVLLTLVCRFVVVFGLTFFLNKTDRLRRIDIEEQFIMAYGGLRGAVAFSLVDVVNANNLPRGHFLTTTIVVIFFTVFVQGITIKPLVKILRVKMEDKQQKLIAEEINTHVTDHVMAGIEEILGKRGEHRVREMLEHYNRHYLKSWLQRDPISTDEQIMQHFEKLALQQHFESLSGSKMIQEKYGGDDYENISIDDNEEPISDSESDTTTGMILPIPSLQASTDNLSDISSSLGIEYLRENVDKRRKSLFPVNLTKNEESRLVDNPTASDVRKIMVPPRRQLQFKRLDKNLKTEDSENDLIRYLQDKQNRTRRASRAVLGLPSSIPDTPERSFSPARRRKSSLAPAAITNNYRRRLSLAVPGMEDNQARRRLVSAGNVLKGVDSPARRRLMLRKNKALSMDCSEKSGDSPVLQARGFTAKFSLSPPSSPRRFREAPASLGIISEHDDECHNDIESKNVIDSDIELEHKRSPTHHMALSEWEASKYKPNQRPTSPESESIDMTELGATNEDVVRPLISPSKSPTKKTTQFFPAKRSPSAVRRDDA